MTRERTGRAGARKARHGPDATDPEGLTTGTLILTADGEMPVEYLCPGDRLISRDAGMVRLRDVERRRLSVRAIRFVAGEGEGGNESGRRPPAGDVILPAGQRILLRGWRAQALFGRARALVRAGQLVDGAFVRDLGPREMVLHRLIFEAPHILYAGGLEIVAEAAGASRSSALGRAA